MHGVCFKYWIGGVSIQISAANLSKKGSFDDLEQFKLNNNSNESIIGAFSSIHTKFYSGLISFSI